MSLLFRIVYAAHANGTHHKLALDALRELNVDNAQDWERLFLKHAELFLEGSKAPDKEFKDFKNHVLHPGDDYWGGAPEKVRNWYAHTVTALREENWPEAAYCAGVMSHYYTDPVHPFHTAQSKAENAIHRAAEWSINRSYNALRREALERNHVEKPSVPTGDNWIELFVCQSADRANQDYERLIAHYDINAGAVIPENGLDRIGRDTIGVLMLYAASGFACLLERAIIEADITAPKVNLTADTFLATLKIPSKWVIRKLDDAEDRRVVQAMFDELLKTGDVEKTLPEDDRAVRDAHDREIGSKRRDARDSARKARCNGPRKTTSPPTRAPKVTTTSAPQATPTAPMPAAAAPAAKPRDTSLLSSLNLAMREGNPVPTPPAPQTAGTPPQADRVKPQKPRASSVPPIAGALPQSFRTESDKPPREPRFYLELNDDIVDAPSIGPKTAKRLEPADLFTVRDLMSCDPDTVAGMIDARHITATAIRDWQHQTRLVLTIPELRGTHAQLLVGAGFKSADTIASASTDDVCAGVLDYARSAEGQRLLRDGAAPDIEKIKTWCENAQNSRSLAA